METILDRIRIILVEPAGALNVGAVARVMKNMGLSHLVLVNPQCDVLGAEARQMAVHAGELLENARQVSSLPEALRECDRAIATTGRDTTLEIAIEPPRTALPWLLPSSPEKPTSDAALIFGREDRGLTNEELNYAQRLIRIPSSPAYTSLNLAQAVAICCYELYTWAIAPDSAQTMNLASAPMPAPASFSSAIPSDLASLDALEQYYQQLEALLLKVGYLYPHTAASRMEKFRRLFNRAYPSTTEVAMLRGILSQTEWALQQGLKAEAIKPQEKEWE